MSIEDGNADAEVLTHVKIAVEDHGQACRSKSGPIFERFSRHQCRATLRERGRRARARPRRRAHPPARWPRWVEDRSDGQQGARFVIELPARMPIDYVTVLEVDDAEPSPTTSGEPWASPTVRGLAIVALAAVLVTAGGCAIQPDSAPRDIPEDLQERETPTASAAGGVAAGSERIYLLAPDGSDAPLRTGQRGPEETPRRC